MVLKSCQVSDEFGAKAEPLLPRPRRDKSKAYRRRRGAGRKPMASRPIFEVTGYVLKTGIQWTALPEEYDSSSRIHRYFLGWTEAGFFPQLWEKVWQNMLM